LWGKSANRAPLPTPGSRAHLRRFRFQMKLGNRDLTGADFGWVDEDAIA